MSTRSDVPRRPGGPWPDGPASWEDRTRVFLRPIAAPSILGLFGFAGATFMVATYLAGWYGTSTSPTFLFEFAAIFGGVAQFTAAMWAFVARDGLATAMHGMWGSFWIAYGILFLLVAVGVLAVPATGAFPELGYWFIVLAVITAIGAVAATIESAGLFATLVTLAGGSACLAIHYLTGVHAWQTWGGWVLFASSVFATYTAASLMFESTFGRTILPMGKPAAKDANVPGARFTKTLQHEHGEPGVKQGQ
jgi:succinate-acetate transporter protein